MTRPTNDDENAIREIVDRIVDHVQRQEPIFDGHEFAVRVRSPGRLIGAAVGVEVN